MLLLVCVLASNLAWSAQTNDARRSDGALRRRPHHAQVGLRDRHRTHRRRPRRPSRPTSAGGPSSTSARIASHSATGVIELMPASDGRTYGFKFVSGHPEPGTRPADRHRVRRPRRRRHRLPRPVGEMTILTALRTAATSAMAARALARPDSTTMALIGTGSQAEFRTGLPGSPGHPHPAHLGHRPAAMDTFESATSPLGFTVHRAANAVDACAGADIVTTCTADKTNATVLTDAMVRPGMHLNAIGGDCPARPSSTSRSCAAPTCSSSSPSRPASRRDTAAAP